MRNGGGLPRGKCSELRGAGDLAGSGIRREGRSARVTHLQLAANPSARCLYRATGSTIVRSDLLEVMKHMLCAVGRPKGQELVVAIRQSATAAHGNEPWITLRRQDHACHSSLRQDGVLPKIHRLTGGLLPIYALRRLVATPLRRRPASRRGPLAVPCMEPRSAGTRLGNQFGWDPAHSRWRSPQRTDMNCPLASR